MKPDVVRTEAWDVDRRLAELGGLSRADLVETVLVAAAAVGGCTANDPPGARGYVSYKSGVRHLRDVHLLKKGWAKDDTAGFCTIVNRKARIRIAIANTDLATGNPEFSPTNRSKRGTLSEQAVRANQGDFFHREVEPEDAAAPYLATWYLCLYISETRVRAELGLPTSWRCGFFEGWNERLILIGSDDDWAKAARPMPDADDGPSFDVVVRRK